MTRSGRSRKHGATDAATGNDAIPALPSDRWSSAFTFVLAATGASIGFTNIWQFPGLAAQYGGGAFVIAYLAFVALFGVPLLIAELLLGRSARASPVHALRLLSPHRRHAAAWSVAGWVAVAACFIVFSYLSVIAGWMLAYVVRVSVGAFAGQTADGMASLFTALVRDPEKQLFWHAGFVAACAWVVARGLRRGLEPLTRVAVPAVFVLLLALVGYVVTIGSFGGALLHLLEPDFAKLSAMALLTAAGQAFFSLGLGFGMMITYGAYLREDVSIPRAALTVAGLDTLTALIAAILVFAVLFAGGVEPASGPGLVFQALPLAFDHLPYGRWFATLFFLLLSLVALLRAIPMLETVVLWVGERFRLGRVRAAAAVATAAWALGLVTVLSFNYWAFSFSVFGAEKKLGMFDLLQVATTHVLLPVGALLLAIFAGWILRAETTREALALRSPCAYDAWIWSLRLAVPLVLLVLLFNLHKLYP